MSEAFEYRRDDIPGTEKECIRCARRSGWGDLPHLSLVLHLIAEVEYQLPVLSGEIFIGSFS